MNTNTLDDSSLPSTLSIGELLDGYCARRFGPVRIVEHVLERVAQAAERHVWISLLPKERVLGYARALESKIYAASVRARRSTAHRRRCDSHRQDESRSVRDGTRGDAVSVRRVPEQHRR
jgi:hypothetical protein